MEDIGEKFFPEGVKSLQGSGLAELVWDKPSSLAETICEPGTLKFLRSKVTHIPLKNLL